VVLGGEERSGSALATPRFFSKLLQRRRRWESLPLSIQIGVLGIISVRGTVLKLPSAVIRRILNRRYASFKFQERLYQIDLCPG
jgi:hypothetical protein